MELAGRLVGGALIALGVAAATAAAVAGRGRPAAAIVAHAYPIPSREQRIQVEVLNATARPSLARMVTRLLRSDGIDVVFFGNAEDNARPDSTRVIARRGDRSSAERVARALGQGIVSVRTDTLRRVDVTVLLGADYRPPPDPHP